jgi:hypothetical protein
MSKIDQLKFVKDVTFDEVFENWRENEEHNPGWVETATKIKGFETWEEWRMYQASFLDLAAREWKLYEIKDPAKSIPEFLVGPFQAWQKQLNESDRNKLTFAEFLKQRVEWATNHKDIMNLSKKFPTGTKMMGLYLEDQDKIVCYEGSHRCAGVALAELEGREVDFGTLKPLIAITVISGNTRELMDEVLSKKSDNPTKE